MEFPQSNPLAVTARPFAIQLYCNDLHWFGNGSWQSALLGSDSLKTFDN